MRAYFYPRSPCGERRNTHTSTSFIQIFLSTLSLRRATQADSDHQGQYGISIHALLAESDGPERPGQNCQSISIHALLAESDRPPGLLHSWRCYFYPRSPCGERRRHCINCMTHMHFYPRSPCGERLLPQSRLPQPPQNFYPRSPCGERHFKRGFVRLFAYFYPRSPCGERPCAALIGIQLVVFLSTLSLRRATFRAWAVKRSRRISIHALLAESDVSTGNQILLVIVFLSTLSLRRATNSFSLNINGPLFLSTLSLRRATL